VTGVRPARGQGSWLRFTDAAAGSHDLAARGRPVWVLQPRRRPRALRHLETHVMPNKPKAKPAASSPPDALDEYYEAMYQAGMFHVNSHGTPVAEGQEVERSAWVVELHKRCDQAWERLAVEANRRGIGPERLLKLFQEAHFPVNELRECSVEQRTPGEARRCLMSEEFHRKIVMERVEDLLRRFANPFLEFRLVWDLGAVMRPAPTSAASQTPPQLNEKQRQALAYIKSEGPKTAKEIGRMVDTTEDNVRRWCQANPPGVLYQHGVRNDRDGEGYYCHDPT
jgi:hypothetical protein